MTERGKKMLRFISRTDYRVMLLFLFFFAAALTVFLSRWHNRTDCKHADFKVASENFMVHETVTFTSDTKEIREWDFGDGTSASRSQTAGHRYILPGKYRVRLALKGGCYKEKVIHIKGADDGSLQKPVAVIIAPDVVRAGDPVSFDYHLPASADPAASWEWSFGESGALDNTASHPTYIFRVPGKKRVSLIINGDVRHMSFKDIFVKPREPAFSESRYRQKIKEDAALEAGPPQADPADEYVRSLAVAPSPRPAAARGSSDSMAAEISEEQFEVLLLDIAKQRKTKEDAGAYICSDYELPVIKNRTKLMTFRELCLALKGKKIRIERLALTRDPAYRNCIVSIDITYKVKKNLIWMKD